MRRSLLVAQRELLENARTKGFWIGIMMMPVMLLLLGIVPLLVESTREAKQFAVIDKSGWLLDEVRAEISTDRFVLTTPDNLTPENLNRLIQQQQLFAYFIIGEDPIDNSDDFKYVSNNLTDRELLNWFTGLVSEKIQEKRLEQVNIDKATAAWITESTRFDGVQISSEGHEEQVDSQDIARQWAPVVFVYLLWISILLNTQMLLTNMIEEKSNKLIEVLLSSISAIQLMAGKILGIAMTGLTIIAAWALMALFFFISLPSMLDIKIPLDLTGVINDPVYISSFFVYFVLGYLLYAAILVGLGSVCSNLKDAQNLMLPVQLVQVIPILLMIPIGRDPNGTLAQFMSYIPPLTPFVMMNRAAAPPTDFEYIVTTALLIVSIALVLWLAARIFRVGILMTGKPPGFIAMIRWFRTPG